MTDITERETRVSASDIRRLCGNVSDHQVAAIEASNAGIADVEAAMAWITGDGAILARNGHPLAERARAVYDILAPEAEGWDDERS